MLCMWLLLQTTVNAFLKALLAHAQSCHICAEYSQAVFQMNPLWMGPKVGRPCLQAGCGDVL